MSKITTTAPLAAAALALALSATVHAQTPAGPAQQSFGVFAGFTDFDRGGTNPTLGLELENNLEGPWSVGGVLEHSSSGFRDQRSTLTMATLNYRPPGTDRLKFTGGAGYEFNRFGDDVRLRVGVGYDLVQGPMTLTPRIAFDFGNSREDLVLGATAYFRF